MKENILCHKKDILPLNEIFREIIFSEADNKNLQNAKLFSFLIVLTMEREWI